jgi:hypothetical protein
MLGSLDVDGKRSAWAAADGRPSTVQCLQSTVRLGRYTVDGPLGPVHSRRSANLVYGCVIHLVAVHPSWVDHRKWARALNMQ